jgi:hypothetical protein
MAARANEKSMSTTTDDPRWQRLMQSEWTCGACGGLHKGIPALACPEPAHWPAVGPRASNAAVHRSRHFLSEDFCVLEGQHFFIRCVLSLPIQGTDGTFDYGVWSSLSEKNFRAYVDSFDGGEQSGLGPWFGWFSNQLPGYPDTLSLKCMVHPRDGGDRPWLELEPTEHPLAVEQRGGISLDRLLEIHALNGHDLGRAVAD